MDRTGHWLAVLASVVPRLIEKRCIIVHVSTIQFSFLFLYVSMFVWVCVFRLLNKLKPGALKIKNPAKFPPEMLVQVSTVSIIPTVSICVFDIFSVLFHYPTFFLWR